MIFPIKTLLLSGKQLKKRENHTITTIIIVFLFVFDYVYKQLPADQWWCGQVEDVYPPWWSLLAQNSSLDRIVGYNPYYRGH
jgi:hypothetical protein